MDDKTLAPETSTQELLEGKDIRQAMLDSSYLIIGILLFVVNLALQLIVINDGEFVLASFEGYDAIDWIIFVASILIPPVLGVVSTSMLKKQGVATGKKSKEYEDVIAEYESLVTSKTRDYIPRSERDFIKAGAKKSYTLKAAIGAGLSLYTSSSLLAGFSLNKILGAIINILMWVVFGWMAYKAGREYAAKELLDYYRNKINDLKAENKYRENLVEVIKNGTQRHDRMGLLNAVSKDRAE